MALDERLSSSGSESENEEEWEDAEPEEQPQHAPVCNVNHESGHRSAFSLNSMQDHSIITHRGDIDPHAEKRLLRKCDLRIIPITFWLYLLQHLDRTNVGNAKILGKLPSCLSLVMYINGAYRFREGHWPSQWPIRCAR